MPQDYRDLLKPDVINSVSGLSLIARVITDSWLAGVNYSRKVGTGMEFSQYRGYQAGDDLRLLDWKMLARSGRYYVKQSEIDTNIAVRFILDASASMQHEENGLSKMQYARVLIAALAWLAQTEGDAVGLFALNQHKMYSVYPKIQKQHYNRLLFELLNIKSEGKWPEKGELSLEKIHDRRHKELIFFITDMHEYDHELTDIIQSLKTSANEVAVIQIAGQKELDFSYSGILTFEDIETGRKVKVDAAEAQKAYRQAMEQRVSEIRTTFLHKNIGFELFTMGQPMGDALNIFLKKRMALI